MNVRKYRYLLSLLMPATILFSIWSIGYWTYSTLFLSFFIIPFLELFFKSDRKNYSEEEERIEKQSIYYDIVIYLSFPIQFLALGLFLLKVGDPHFTLYEKIGITSAFGISCGVLGINIAHELGHRHRWYEQTMAKLLLLSTQYLHFFIEHNRGHHKNVSTDEDAASAKRGENIHFFIIRSITESWISAWRLETQRLAQQRESTFTLKNQMIRFQIYQILLIGSIYFFFGTEVLAYYVIASAIGIILIESTNYIQHYGLRRKKDDDIYSKVKPIHSWNSDYPLGRILLFELSRHSDHHYNPSRKYQILRSHEQSPQMPTGYPGMMLLAMIPPLWFRIMNARIDYFKQTEAGQELD